MNALIRNLTLARKFALLSILAVLMLVLPAVLVFIDRMADLQTVRHEQGGMAPARALLRLVDGVQAHRSTTLLARLGDAQAAANRAAVAAQVRAAVALLQTELPPMGHPELTARATGLAAQWQTLEQAADKASGTVLASVDAHEALVGDALTLLEDVAAAAELTLHAHPSGYYLQLVALGHLPQMTESLDMLRALGTLLRAPDVDAASLRSRIGFLAGEVAQRQKDIGRNLDHAREGDTSSLRQKIDQPALRAREAVQAALTLATAAAEGSGSGGSATAFAAALERHVAAQKPLLDIALRALDADLESMAHRALREMALVAVAIGLGALAAGWVMWVTVRATVADVNAALRLAEAVAGGDLEQAVTSGGRDELGRLLRALDDMRLRLAQVVQHVRHNADSVATASVEIAQGNQNLSHRTETQASALQQTAASMEQLNAAIRRNADSAQQADVLAKDASRVAVEGGSLVVQVVDTMQGIQQSSQRIGEIIGVIDGIAFQTNILALNAAVEAARAGDQGRGFAVVAAEVRALARRSADAAREVKQLITANSERIDHGSSLVGRTGQTMTGIVDAIQLVAALVREISAATHEQSAGVAQVGEAVNQMDRGTQQNAALVEQSAAAADSLRQQAAQLAEAVAAFRVAAGAAAA